MTQREELNEDQKKLNWLLGLEKETLVDMAHQQSKIIEKLQKAAKAQAAPRWIPVSERLPDEFTAVLVYDVDGTHGHVYTLKVYAEFFSKFKSVTHWMPLPAAPEQNK